MIADAGVDHYKETPDEFESYPGEVQVCDEWITRSLFVTLVDNFQTYLAELLVQIFNSRPEVLSGGNVKNRMIFQSADLDSLKREIIERHVLDLGYKGVEEIDEYFSTHFKFPLVDPGIGKARLNRLVQIRNVISHNRGIVNAIFMKRAGCRADRIGSEVSLPNLHSTDRYLSKLAEAIDHRAITKFNIPCSAMGDKPR